MIRVFLRHVCAEMRGGIRDFRLYVLCIALGVGVFAAISCTIAAVLLALQNNAAVILGGDVELRLVHRTLSETERRTLEGTVRELSHVSLMRTMARSEEGAVQLVELKAVDDHYPLIGQLRASAFGSLHAQALAERLVREGEEEGEGEEEKGGDWGALVAPALLAHFGAQVGDSFTIGKARFRILDTIVQESDGLSGGLALGPRVLVSREALQATGLLVPGSLVYERYRAKLAPEQSLPEWLARHDRLFQQPTWDIRDRRDAVPSVRQAIDNLSVFMSLAALTALLTSGSGIANGLTRFFAKRQVQIALWKCLGASSAYIRALYGVQVSVMGGLGLGIGLGLASLATWLLVPWIGAAFLLPLEGTTRELISPDVLLRALATGACIIALFALPPFLTIDSVSPSSLLREMQAPQWRENPWARLIRIALLSAPLCVLLFVLTLWDSPNPKFTFIALVCLLASLPLFPLSSRAVLFLVYALRTRYRTLSLSPALDYAIRQTRAYGALLSIVLPLGLGLSLLVALEQVERNLSRAAQTGLAREAPRQFLINILPEQVPALRSALQRVEAFERLDSAPMLRGNILAMKGVPSDEIEVPKDYEWVLGESRGISMARRPPDKAEIVEGEWWDEDYDGPPLVSLDADIARAFALGIGDKLRIGVLGHSIEAEIANLRTVDWWAWGINFVMVFSPGSFEGLPFAVIAAVFAKKGSENAIQKVVADSFPNVSVFSIGDIIRIIESTLSGIAHAVRAVSLATLAMGALVLASAVLLEQQRRVYESVVMKTLGISRRSILLSFFAEYTLIGLTVAFLSVAFGTSAAWAILKFAMQADSFSFSLRSALLLSLGVFASMGALSILSAGYVLSKPSAPLLRNP